MASRATMKRGVFFRKAEGNIAPHWGVLLQATEFTVFFSEHKSFQFKILSRTAPSEIIQSTVFLCTTASFYLICFTHRKNPEADTYRRSLSFLTGCTPSFPWLVHIAVGAHRTLIKHIADDAGAAKNFLIDHRCQCVCSPG